MKVNSINFREIWYFNLKRSRIFEWRYRMKLTSKTPSVLFEQCDFSGRGLTLYYDLIWIVSTWGIARDLVVSLIKFLTATSIRIGIRFISHFNLFLIFLIPLKWNYVLTPLKRTKFKTQYFFKAQISKNSTLHRFKKYANRTKRNIS